MSDKMRSNIDICLKTRTYVANSLYKILCKFENSKISERQLKEIWKERTCSNPEIGEKGWYEPPELGFAVLSCDENNRDRLDFSTLREEKYWSRNDIYFSNKYPAFFYGSPFNKESGIIGDFGITLYAGTDFEIRNHLKKSLEIGRKISQYAEVGMEIRELYEFGIRLFQEYEVTNLVFSATDPLNFDFGHTIPWTYEIMTEDENNILRIGNWTEIKNMISKKRKFVNSEQNLKIKQTMAFTIEPRLKSLSNKEIPTASFHMIVAFKDGIKTINDDFYSIFKLWNMDYLN